MIKILAYRFTLFILLFSGLGQLSANIYFMAEGEPASACFKESDQITSFVSFSKEKQEDRLTMLLFENEEKEDDELVPFKKHLEIANCTTSLLFTPTFECFVNFPKKVYSFNGDLSYTSTCRYLSLQVFRI
ncbi:MAG TPA: hypothetical protein VL728_17060 [Cyclobacteriaceae bacterium]|jgi:hypothetical protein|nr:hypothetical protein [Cyclobacteriaceae bacterium]